MYYGHPWGMSGFGFFGLIGGLLSFLFWILIILLIVRLIRRGRGRRGHWRHMWDRDAVEILRERFAKGEINKEDFEERIRTLEANEDKSR